MYGPTVSDSARSDVQAVLESGHLAAGDEVAAFQSEFADHCGCEHAIATANGTAALHAALEAVDVRGGSVVTTPFSFVATANAIKFAGADPVFADIDPEGFNLDPERVASQLKRHADDVSAILVVHLYGLPAPMSELRTLADRYNIPLVEDAAQAHGAMYDGAHVGTLGDVGCFSFYPTKNMTTGEGGMITTDRGALADRVRQFIDHGRPVTGTSHPYAHVGLGHNYRMTDIAAAIGRSQLTRLPAFVSARRENAARLTDNLAAAPVSTPDEPPDCRHAYHQYTIRCQDGSREGIRAKLDAEGVDCAIYYPSTIPDLAAYDGTEASIPVARRAAREVLSVPVHPGLADADVEIVTDALREATIVDV